MRRRTAKPGGEPMPEDKGQLLLEKQRKLKLHKFLATMLRCTPASVIILVAITLFAIFMTGDFEGAFTPEKGLATAGRFLATGIVFLATFFCVYSYCDDGRFAGRNYTLVTVVMAVVFIACLAASRFLNVFAMPIALCSLVIVELLDRRTSAVATVSTAVLVLLSYIFRIEHGNEIIYWIAASVVCNTIGALGINFLLEWHLSRLKFMIGALTVLLFAQPLVIVSTLATGDHSINVLYNVLYSYAASVASVLVFMPFVTALESGFNIADDFKLGELTNLNHPLLKRLAGEAPGTFNHSLVVGTLAETCASAIGENPNLARAAAYYHDIGKLKAPLYFSENQSTYNPHDELIPEVSVSMITSHTLFGEILAKQYRLPREIVEICRQHHGTSPVGYFYRKALNLTEEGALPVGGFTYSGPKPQSKIAAVVMIADTVEAAMRASIPDNKDDFVKKVDQLVDEKISLGQMDECPITMRDLTTIKNTIIEVLPSIHHSRIPYEKQQ